MLFSSYNILGHNDHSLILLGMVIIFIAIIIITIMIIIIGAKFKLIDISLHFIDYQGAKRIFFLAEFMVCMQVRNTGSWLEMGSSITHFVIVSGQVVLLLLLFGLTHIYTKNIQIGSMQHSYSSRKVK